MSNICKVFIHFPSFFLHHIVLAKLATTSIRIKETLGDKLTVLILIPVCSIVHPPPVGGSTVFAPSVKHC